jgi:hypothetical protein
MTGHSLQEPLFLQREFVPNAPIREAVERAIALGELESFGELARRLGYGSDSSRVRRLLGITKSWGGRRALGGAKPPKCSTSMSYENAVAVVRAINRFPVDFDL